MVQLTIVAACLALFQYCAATPTPVASAELEKRTDHAGEATFYYQGGAAGSCGQVHSDSDYIVALSNYWQKNQSPGPFCGRKIRVTNNGGGQNNSGKGRQVTVTVADTCPSCNENHIDFSVGAFKGLTGGPLDPPGTFNITWHFCNANGQC